MLRDTFALARLIADPRNIRLLLKVHRQFSKDKDYSFLNMAKALWLSASDERIVMHNNSYVISSFLPPIPSRAFDNLFSAVPNKGTLFHEHANAIRTAPISVYIAVTDRCSYACAHCSRANRKKDAELSLSELKKLIAGLQEMGTSIIGLTGGEPLLRNDLLQIIKSIDDRSISVLYTSGFGLTGEKAREFKRAGLFSTGISLDHYDEAACDRSRGHKGAYKAALDAVSYSRNADLYTMVQFIATKEMIHNNDIWKMIRFAGKIHADEVRILESMPTGCLLKADNSVLLNPDERKELIKIHRKANWSPDLPKVGIFAHTECHDRFGCGAGTQHTYIDAEGNLCPCDFVPLSFGDVRKKDIRQLWKNMNSLIGIPRERCLLFEIHDKLVKEYKGSLPLNEEASARIIDEIGKPDKLPGFYRALGGKK